MNARTDVALSEAKSAVSLNLAFTDWEAGPPAELLSRDMTHAGKRTTCISHHFADPWRNSSQARVFKFLNEIRRR